jgi:hypothetical protein
MDVPGTRYVRSGEIAIAYQVHGSGDHDLVFSGSTASNIETAWALPEAVRLFERSRSTGASPGESSFVAGRSPATSRTAGVRL